MKRAVSHVPPRTPTNLPTTRPHTTPTAAMSPAAASRSGSDTATPADMSANAGTATPAETGRTAVLESLGGRRVLVVVGLDRG